MASTDAQIAQLEAAIAAQEALRPQLGDAAVDAVRAALRQSIEALRAQGTAAPQLAGALEADQAAEQALARMQRYLPAELAARAQATRWAEGERRQVTVLFADLAGFTDLSENADPELIRAFQNDLFPEMAQIIYQYEGFIEKFVGDAVMAVFGAPMAHEDDPERALRAALGMRERMAEVNRRWSERLGGPLTLHIGINTGTVVAGVLTPEAGQGTAYAVTGDTVNTAARLEDRSQPGQILVSRTTFRLTNAAFQFQALEPIQIRGKRDPLPVYELLRARLLPGKTRGLRELGEAFVGRDTPLAQLQATADELAAGRGRILFVTGEAGLGKSRLLAEWRKTVEPNIRWLEGRCFAHTISQAYGPFLDLLRRFAGITDDDSDTRARSRLNTAVRRLYVGNNEAPAIFANLLAMRLSSAEAKLIAAMPARDLRERIFSLAEDLFTRLTRERPTVLQLEDMHWSDVTSEELIERLLPLTLRLPLAVVIVTRPSEDTPVARLQELAETRYAARATRITLEPLSPEACVAMVHGLLQTPEPPPALSGTVAQQAEGNPFFIEEILRALIERGALERLDTGVWRETALLAAMHVPDTLQGLIMARIDRLPDETKHVVQQASVIGRTFFLRVLTEIAGHGDTLAADLSHLQRRELIHELAREPELEYVFKHALTQEVAYESLLASQRRELHRQVGEAMERLFADRLPEHHAVISHHLDMSEQWGKAADYHLLAGDQAGRMYAAEARLHYAGAVDAIERLPESQQDPRQLSDAVLKLCREENLGWAAGGDLAGQFGAALQRLHKVESAVRTLAAASAQSVEERKRLAEVHSWMGATYYKQGNVEQAVLYCQEALNTHDVAQETDLLVYPSFVLGSVRLLQGYWDEAERLLAAAVDPFAARESWYEWTLTNGGYAAALAAQGHCAEGLARAEDGVRRAEALKALPVLGLANVRLALTCLLGDDPERAAQAGQVAAAIGAQLTNKTTESFASLYLAWSAARSSDVERTRLALQQAEALNLAGTQDLRVAVSAELALQAGEPATALLRAREAVDLAEPRKNIFTEGLARRTWGRALAAVEPANAAAVDEQMAASLRAFEAGNSRVEAARTELAWGELCRARGDQAAQAHLVRAETFFQEAGLEHELAHTRTLLGA